MLQRTNKAVASLSSCAWCHLIPHAAATPSLLHPNACKVGKSLLTLPIAKLASVLFVHSGTACLLSLRGPSQVEVLHITFSQRELQRLYLLCSHFVHHVSKTSLSVFQLVFTRTRHVCNCVCCRALLCCPPAIHQC